MSNQYYDMIKVQRVPLYEQIVNQLEDLIIANKLQPGDRLPSERQLAERLGVGRPAIREAILVLQERGLVESMPGSGTYVRQVSGGSIARRGLARGRPHCPDVRRQARILPTSDHQGRRTSHRIDRLSSPSPAQAR